MGGFFGGDDGEEAPPVNFQPYTPVDATKTTQPINFMKIFDNVSGQEFVFKKSPKGERYIQLQSKIKQKQKRLDEAKDGYSRNKTQFWLDRQSRLRNQISELEGEASNLERYAGDTEMQINDLSGRLPIDAPFESILPEIGNLQDVDLNLPEVRELLPFEMRYAAAVSDVSSRLRELHDTITGLDVADPMSIRAYQPYIQAFKDANARAAERGFDIKQNGLDAKLREMGLNNSTTALGAMMVLQKQKIDTEVENNLKEYTFANNLKQESIQNLLKLGSGIASEGDLAFKQYSQDSSNQINLRNQELSQNELKQQRARAIQAAQLQMRQQDLAKESLILDKGKTERQSELAKRELTLNMLLNRDPSKMGLNFIANNNTNAVNAVGVTNTGLFNKQQGELQASSLEQQRFANEQASKSDPLGTILNTGLGAFAGSAGKTIGKNLFNK